MDVAVEKQKMYLQTDGLEGTLGSGVKACIPRDKNSTDSTS